MPPSDMYSAFCTPSPPCRATRSICLALLLRMACGHSRPRRPRDTTLLLSIGRGEPTPTPCDILPYDKRLNASEFPRLLSARRVRVTYTSRSQADSPPCPSLFASPIRLFHRCPVTRKVYTMAMNIHSIESTTLHFAKHPRSKQADLPDSIMFRLQC